MSVLVRAEENKKKKTKEQIDQVDFLDSNRLELKISEVEVVLLATTLQGL